MADEIEDRFLVFTPPLLVHLIPAKIVQGYLSDSQNLSVRVHKSAIAIKGNNIDLKYPVPAADLPGLQAAFKGDLRIRTVDGVKAYITVKGKKTGNTAPEFEYSIPVQEAELLHQAAGKLVITKDRYEIPGADSHVWELDIFTGRHAGLMIAELELPDSKTVYQKPDWLGPEVTQDKRFSNASLARSSTIDIMEWADEYRPKPQGPSRPAPSP